MAENNKTWQFSHPGKVVSEPLFDYLKTSVHADSILLVTSPGFTRRGLSARIAATLGADRLQIFDQIKPNPDLDDLDVTIKTLRGRAFKLIIALGGGSVIDSAKALSASLRAPSGKSLSEIVRAQKTPVFEAIPVIAVPTTSGTGSEVTQFATIWHSKTGQKYSMEGEHLFPAVALLDPDLCLTLPASETLFTGLDAISHALESLWNINSNPVSKMYAATSLDYVLASFAQVMKEPADLQARRQMQLASLFAGYAISITRTAIAHAISYPLTARLNIPHGLACGFTLPTLIRLTSESAMIPAIFTARFAAIKALLATTGLPEQIQAHAGKSEILALLPEMFSPTRIANFKLPADVHLVEKILLTSLV